MPYLIKIRHEVFECNKCNALFTCKHFWKKHFSLNCPRRYSCIVCNLDFISSYLLQAHVSTSHHAALAFSRHMVPDEIFKELEQEGKINTGISISPGKIGDPKSLADQIENIGQGSQCLSDGSQIFAKTQGENKDYGCGANQRQEGILQTCGGEEHQISDRWDVETCIGDRERLCYEGNVHIYNFGVEQLYSVENALNCSSNPILSTGKDKLDCEERQHLRDKDTGLETERSNDLHQSEIDSSINNNATFPLMNFTKKNDAEGKSISSYHRTAPFPLKDPCEKSDTIDKNESVPQSNATLPLSDISKNIDAQDKSEDSQYSNAIPLEDSLEKNDPKDGNESHHTNLESQGKDCLSPNTYEESDSNIKSKHPSVIQKHPCAVDSSVLNSSVSLTKYVVDSKEMSLESGDLSDKSQNSCPNDKNGGYSKLTASALNCKMKPFKINIKALSRQFKAETASALSTKSKELNNSKVISKISKITTSAFSKSSKEVSSHKKDTESSKSRVSFTIRENALLKPVQLLIRQEEEGFLNSDLSYPKEANYSQLHKLRNEIEKEKELKAEIAKAHKEFSKKHIFGKNKHFTCRERYRRRRRTYSDESQTDLSSTLYEHSDANINRSTRDRGKRIPVVKDAYKDSSVKTGNGSKKNHEKESRRNAIKDRDDSDSEEKRNNEKWEVNCIDTSYYEKCLESWANGLDNEVNEREDTGSQQENSCFSLVDGINDSREKQNYEINRDSQQESTCASVFERIKANKTDNQDQENKGTDSQKQSKCSSLLEKIQANDKLRIAYKTTLTEQEAENLTESHQISPTQQPSTSKSNPEMSYSTSHESDSQHPHGLVIYSSSGESVNRAKNIYDNILSQDIVQKRQSRSRIRRKHNRSRSSHTSNNSSSRSCDLYRKSRSKSRERIRGSLFRTRDSNSSRSTSTDTSRESPSRSRHGNRMTWSGTRYRSQETRSSSTQRSQETRFRSRQSSQETRSRSREMSREIQSRSRQRSKEARSRSRQRSQETQSTSSRETRSRSRQSRENRSRQTSREIKSRSRQTSRETHSRSRQRSREIRSRSRQSSREIQSTSSRETRSRSKQRSQENRSRSRQRSREIRSRSRQTSSETRSRSRQRSREIRSRSRQTSSETESRSRQRSRETRSRSRQRSRDTQSTSSRETRSRSRQRSRETRSRQPRRETQSRSRQTSREPRSTSRQRSREIQSRSRQTSSETRSRSRQRSKETRSRSRQRNREIRSRSRQTSPETRSRSRQRSKETRSRSRQRSQEIQSRLRNISRGTWSKSRQKYRETRSRSKDRSTDSETIQEKEMRSEKERRIKNRMIKKVKKKKKRDRKHTIRSVTHKQDENTSSKEMFLKKENSTEEKDYKENEVIIISSDSSSSDEIIERISKQRKRRRKKIGNLLANLVNGETLQNTSLSSPEVTFKRRKEISMINTIHPVTNALSDRHASEKDSETSDEVKKDTSDSYSNQHSHPKYMSAGSFEMESLSESDEITRHDSREGDVLKNLVLDRIYRRYITESSAMPKKARTEPDKELCSVSGKESNVLSTTEQTDSAGCNNCISEQSTGDCIMHEGDRTNISVQEDEALQFYDSGNGLADSRKPSNGGDSSDSGITNLVDISERDYDHGLVQSCRIDSSTHEVEKSDLKTTGLKGDTKDEDKESTDSADGHSIAEHIEKNSKRVTSLQNSNQLVGPESETVTSSANSRDDDVMLENDIICLEKLDRDTSFSQEKSDTDSVKSFLLFDVDDEPTNKQVIPECKRRASVLVDAKNSQELVSNTETEVSEDGNVCHETTELCYRSDNTEETEEIQCNLVTLDETGLLEHPLLDNSCHKLYWTSYIAESVKVKGRTYTSSAAAELQQAKAKQKDASSKPSESHTSIPSSEEETPDTSSPLTIRSQKSKGPMKCVENKMINYLTNTCPECQSFLILDEFTSVNLRTGDITMKCQQCLMYTFMKGAFSLSAIKLSTKCSEKNPEHSGELPTDKKQDRKNKENISSTKGQGTKPNVKNKKPRKVTLKEKLKALNTKERTVRKTKGKYPILRPRKAKKTAAEGIQAQKSHLFENKQKGTVKRKAGNKGGNKAKRPKTQTNEGK